MEWIEPNWTVGWLCGSIHSSEPQHTFVLLNLYQKQISRATCDPQIWDKPGEILLAVSWKEQKWDTRDLGFWLFQEPLHERGLGPLNWEGKGRLSGWLRSILIRDGCVKVSHSHRPFHLLQSSIPQNVGVQKKYSKFWLKQSCLSLGKSHWSWVS